MASGAMLQYSIAARPSGNVGSFLTNTASVQSLDAGVADSDASNDSASDTDPIVGDGIHADGFENPPGMLFAPLR